MSHNSFAGITQIVDEVFRVLSPGGLFVLVDVRGFGDTDRDFGSQVDETGYDFFSDGYFKSRGLTSFLRIEEVSELFKSYDLLELWVNHSSLVDSMHTAETFTIVARR